MVFIFVNRLQSWPLYILIFCFSLFFKMPVDAADATAYGWAFSGLQKEIRNLAFSADGEIVYAGSRDGLYQSLDDGKTWTQIFRDSLAEIRAIAVAKSTPGRLYVGALTGGHQGLFTSVDGGETWTEIETGLGINFFMALALDPNDDRIIYAGTGWGLLKSEDAGVTWRSISDGLEGDTGDLPWVHKIVFDPVDSNIIYALTNKSMIHATPSVGVTPILDGKPDRFNAAQNVRPGIYKTTNAGLSWERLQSNVDFGSLSPADMAIGSTDTRVFYIAATLGIFKTEDGGKMFQEVLGDLLEFPWARSVAIDPMDETIYAGSAVEGIYKSFDNGQSWEQVFNHAPWSDGQASPYSILISHKQGRKIYGGFGRGVFFKELWDTPNSIDFNDNNIIDFQDFLLFAQHFGQSVRVRKIEKRFDLNNDGKINFQDFILFAQSYKK